MSRNLYIAGVIDGPLTGGTPKAVQFCATADIPNLSIYGFGSANNGGGTDGEEYTFEPIIVNAGDCFWVATEITQFNNWFGFEPCFTHGTVPSINGDDAIELFCNSNLVDLFGDQNTSGTGECWEYLDGWAVNNSGAPNNGNFDCADWTFSGINALDGETSNATAETPYPSPEQTSCIFPLPITLTTFTARQLEASKVSLNWTTVSEENNDYFVIEHSADGRYFDELDMVQGAGSTTTSQHYSFIHHHPVAGSNYYRLRQVDFDGTFSFSAIAVVELKSLGEVSLHPTLARHSIDISLGEAPANDAAVEVFNSYGQLVLAATFPAEADKLTLNVGDLETGHYFLRINRDGDMEVLRFMKI